MLEGPDAIGLLFDIQRSIRYHDRRVAHFDLLHKITNVMTIVIAGIVLVELSRDEPTMLWIKVVAALAGLLGAFDLVVGYGTKASLHRDLKSRFAVLERALVKAKADGDLEAIKIERLEIETNEPPIFRALDLLCHNELCCAHGYSRTDAEECKHYKEVGPFERFTANWIRWQNIGT